MHLTPSNARPTVDCEPLNLRFPNVVAMQSIHSHSRKYATLFINIHILSYNANAVALHNSDKKSINCIMRYTSRNYNV